MSDLHGEYESFFHILNNCSGVIKEKVDYLFSEEMSTSQKAEFCTLIYYPKGKILNLKKQKLITTQWYSQNLIYLLRLSRLMSYKYPQSELKIYCLKDMKPSFLNCSQLDQMMILSKRYISILS